MLQVIFVNDLTGDDIIGSYRWEVLINGKSLSKGKLKNHIRLSGWKGLLRYFVEKECKRENEK